MYIFTCVYIFTCIYIYFTYHTNMYGKWNSCSWVHSTYLTFFSLTMRYYFEMEKYFELYLIFPSSSWLLRLKWHFFGLLLCINLSKVIKCFWLLKNGYDWNQWVVQQFYNQSKIYIVLSLEKMDLDAISLTYMGFIWSHLEE